VTQEIRAREAYVFLSSPSSVVPSLRSSSFLSFRPLKFRLSVAYTISTHPPLPVAARYGFPFPPKQSLLSFPTDKTRVVNSTRRKPMHLSLSTSRLSPEPRRLFEILMASVNSSPFGRAANIKC